MTEETYKLLENQAKSEIISCKELEFLNVFIHRSSTNENEIEILMCPTETVGFLSSYIAISLNFDKKTKAFKYRLSGMEDISNIIFPMLNMAINYYFNCLIEKGPDSYVFRRTEQMLWMAYYRLPLTISQDEEEMRLWKELQLLPIEYIEIHRKLLAILNRRNDDIGKYRMEFLLSLISSKISKLYMDIGQITNNVNILKVESEKFRKEPIIGAEVHI
jgi:hypothetical protein